MDNILLWAVQSQDQWRSISIEVWTVPRQTQGTTTPSFAKNWRLQKGRKEVIGADNIPAELVKASGEAIIFTTLLTICNKIWKAGEWPTPWTQSLVITLPKKGNLQLCQNYQMISFISHPSKVMLKIIMNRLKPQAEKIIAEVQAGFRAGRTTIEQIFNWRILCFMRNISSKTVNMSSSTSRRHSTQFGMQRCGKPWRSTISEPTSFESSKHLYDKVTSELLFSGSIGNCFWTTVGVWQGWLLSPTLFNIFLDALEDPEGTVSIGGRKNHQYPLCWWHLWLSMRRRRAGKISWTSQQILHSLWHGEQCQEDQADDKQYQWHQHRD